MLCPQWKSHHGTLTTNANASIFFLETHNLLHVIKILPPLCINFFHTYLVTIVFNRSPLHYHILQLRSTAASVSCNILMLHAHKTGHHIIFNSIKVDLHRSFRMGKRRKPGKTNRVQAETHTQEGAVLLANAWRWVSLAFWLKGNYSSFAWQWMESLRESRRAEHSCGKKKTIVKDELQLFFVIPSLTIDYGTQAKGG